MNKIRTIAATILGGALFCIVLTSCENFLKSQEVKEQILDTIAYNNAPECKVLLKADPAMGEFLSNGEQTFKVGYASEIQFSVVKSAYCFTGFEAVSKLDQNVSLNEYVSFENPVNDDEKGIYKIKVKILKKSDDICIRPVCLEFPCVSEYSPALGQNAANTQLRISFNMPMDQEALTFGSGNIIISSGTTNLNYLFNEPVLSSDSKTLTITPKASQLYDYITESNITVTVELLESITVTRTVNEKQYVLALKKDENTKFSVIYKKEKETKPPVQHEFFVTQMLNSPASASMQDIKNAAQNVSDFAKYSMKTLSEPLDYYKNSSDGSFYIYGRFYDDSGIACVEVTEKRTHNKNGQDVTEAPQTSQYYSSSQNTWFFTEDGYTDFIIKHTLKNEDGEYNITVSVTDSCQNPTIIPDFTAIKSLLKIKDEDKIELYNISLDQVDALEDYYILEKLNDNNFRYSQKCIKQNYKENLKKYLKQVKIDKISSSFYKDFDLQDLFKVECTYLNNTCEMSWNSNKQRYEHTLGDEVDISELQINIKIYIKNHDESYSLQFVKDYYFPPIPVLYDSPNEQVVELAYIPAGKHIDKIYKFVEFSSQYYELMTDYYLQTLPKDYLTTICGIYHNSGTAQYYNNNGYIMYKYGGLHSDILELKYLQESQIFSTASPTITGFSDDSSINETKNSENTDYVDITISPVLKSTLSDIVINNMFVVVSDDQSGWVRNITHVFDTNLTPITFKYPLIERNNKTSFYLSMVSKTSHQIIAKTTLSLSARTDIEIPVEIDPVGFDRYKLTWNSYPINREYAQQDVKTYLGIYKLDDAEIVFCPGTIKQELKELSSIKGNIYLQINNSEEFCYKTDDCILKNVQSPTLWKLYNNYIFIPAWELDKEENTITIRYVGDDSKTASKTFTWQQEDFKNEENYISDKQESYDYFNPTENTWSNYYKTGTEASTVPQNSFIRKTKIYLPMNGGFSYYCPVSYEYKGTKSSGSKTDKLIKNGDLYLIASDQPVLMQTYLTTTNSYNDCKNWSLEQWQKNHRRIDEMVLNFTPETCHTLQYYSPDTSKLRENTCYVIVARYADGHTQMSEVMQK